MYFLALFIHEAISYSTKKTLKTTYMREFGISWETVSKVCLQSY